MVELLAGNVLLKPAQKRRILSHLRRSSRLGELIGDSRLAISLNRTGRTVEAKAKVHNKKGTFECKAKDASWESAFLQLVRTVHNRVHAQRLRRIAA